jgi:putative glycosyltransferase (TIGR04372 family)
MTSNIFFYKLINKIFFSISKFVIVKPLNLPSIFSYKNLFNNLLFFLNQKRWRSASNIIFKLIFKFIINLLKIIYLPFIIGIYFSRFRFIQIDYTQIGTVCLNLNTMSKFHYLNNYIPVICLPKSIDNFCITKIFKDIKIIDNIFFNILLLPLIHTDFISCPLYLTDYYVDSDLKKIGNSFTTKILKDYENKINKKLFNLNENYNNKMSKYLEKNFKNINKNKIYILHVRDNEYIPTSYLRSATIHNYTSTINYLLNSGYSVIRLTNSHSEKLLLKGEYLELNTDILFNRYFQYYLISISKGFIGCSSGASAIGCLFEVPCLAVNLFYLSTYAIKPKDIYIFKKIKIIDGKYLNFKKIFNDRFYETSGSLTVMNANKLVAIENTPAEILNATKEFININTCSDIQWTKEQIDFKNSLPVYSDFSFSDARVSDYFIKNNIELF